MGSHVMCRWTLNMGSSYSSPVHAVWAAREGRSSDLLYHVRVGGRQVCNYRDKKGNTCLHAAAEGGYVACIDILGAAGVCVNARNSEGYIPLHLAVRGGRVAAVRRLLEMGGQVHAETLTSRIAPIHLAAYRGSVPCMKALLDYGADINVQECWGQTPLMLAALRGHTEALIFLLQSATCDTRLREHQYGGEVTHVAMETKELSTLQLLLDSGSSPNAIRTSDSASLLQLAIEHRFTDGVQLLLKYGAWCHPETLKDSRLSRQPLVAMATVQWGQVLSLKEASRVALRRALGPGSVEQRCHQFNLAPPLLEFVLFKDLEPSAQSPSMPTGAGPFTVPSFQPTSLPLDSKQNYDMLQGSRKQPL